MAKTSSALSVYLIAAGFRPPLPSPESFARHYGEGLWIQIADKWANKTVPAILRGLAEARGETTDTIVSSSIRLSDEAVPIVQSTPRERASEIRALLSEGAPSVALFLGLEIAPALLYGMREAGIRTILVASPTGTDIRAHSRFLSRPTFRLFDRLVATNDTARSALIKQGAPASRIEVVGRLDDGAPVPGVVADQQEHMAAVLGGRPVWLASGADLAEIRALLDAQRQANGLSHRLLLVIAPEDPAEGAPMASAAEMRGYTVARRSLGEDPKEDIQIYIADVPGEIGLWYRLAPITFVGKSLVECGGANTPDAPAALGSAILYGPDVGPNRAAFDHLAALGGARLVESGKALGTAVSGLLAPDKPAAMAHAAWLETSKGAEGTDRVIDILMEAFDAPEAF